MSPRILQYPDPSKSYTITVDSSDFACSGILSQITDGANLPVAYFSRTFQKGERNKAIIEKELLAIYLSIMFFRPYEYGTKFTVLSDHKPMIYLFSMKNPSSKLVRIRLELEEYDFEIVHIPGKENVCADTLSRIRLSDLQELSEIDSQILVMTRSMSNRQKRDKAQTEHQMREEISVPIFDNTISNKKVPSRHCLLLLQNTKMVQLHCAHS